MSEETSFQEYGDETDLSLNLSVSLDGSFNTDSNTSSSHSESLVEDESDLKRESEDMFKSDSDTKTTAPGSEDIEADSSPSSFVTETIEDVFGAEPDTSETESKPFTNTEQTGTKFQQSAAEVDDTSTASSEIETNDLFTDKQDGTAKMQNNLAKYRSTRSAKSPTPPAESLIADGNKPSIETSVEDVLDKKIEQDATGSEPEASSQAEENAINVTMEKLTISDSPKSGKKSTPRQSRFRARTINIFDSPYNTRLKARMIKERDMRSRSEEGSTNE